MRVFLSIPLTLIPLAVYLLIAGTTNWNEGVFQLSLPSGATAILKAGEALVGLGIVMLFAEVVKATRSGFAPILDHVLSTGTALTHIVLFIVMPAAGTGVFALLTLIAVIDLVAGFWISLNVARRDVAIAPGGSF